MVEWPCFYSSQESHVGESSVSELQKRLQISVSLSNPKPTMDEMEDREFIELATQLVGGALDSKQVQVLGLIVMIC